MSVPPTFDQDKGADATGVLPETIPQSDGNSAVFTLNLGGVKVGDGIDFAVTGIGRQGDDLVIHRDLADRNELGSRHFKNPF